VRDPQVPPPRGERAPRPILGWVALSAGVVGLGAGALFHVRALSTKDDANGVFEDDPRFAGLADDFQTQRLIAISGYAVGGVALGLGAYLLLRDRDEPAPVAASPGPRVDVTLGPGAALVTVGWER
jgi:hypothetical protein